LLVIGMDNSMVENKNKDQPLCCDASEETLRVMYLAQWNDLHHNRNQDWRLCNLIIVGLLGIGGLKVLGQFPNLQRVLSLLFAAVSLVAIGVTERHRILFEEKMNAIRQLENLLHISDLFKVCSGWRKRFKVQYLLTMIYILFTFFFIYLACIGIVETVQ
jgi:hypothetical protein